VRFWFNPAVANGILLALGQPPPPRSHAGKDGLSDIPLILACLRIYRFKKTNNQHPFARFLHAISYPTTFLSLLLSSAP
jgi:hypothetical protein